MTISASLVRELRDKTGAAMMDCKKALEATGGDLEAAMDHLRKTGLKTAEKKAQRATGEGRITALVEPDGRRGSIVAVECETDFVAATPDFGAFQQGLTEHVLEHAPASLEELLEQRWAGGDERVEAVYKQVIGKLGENVRIAEFRRMENPRGRVASYIHHNHKVGVLVSVTGGERLSEETMKDLCLHVAFHNPPFLSREQVPTELIEREKEVLRESAELKSKPADIREKVVEGRMKTFYRERCLLEQPWVKDDKQTVSQVLGQASIEAFARLEIAG